MKEEWLSVRGIFGARGRPVQVSNLGGLRYQQHNLCWRVSPRAGTKRKRIIGFDFRGKAIERPLDRVVCEEFHGPPPRNAYPLHLNGDAYDASSANLAWVTQSEAIAIGMRRKAALRSERPSRCWTRASGEDEWCAWEDCASAASALGVSPAIVRLVARGAQPPSKFAATLVDPMVETDALRELRMADALQAHRSARSARRRAPARTRVCSPMTV